ncbi:hypothetical protein [Tranquillimonas alkanivorans]|uniref:Uracil DNA glycosylase superfamily protein n=1 Tax=Tranquillimonas alkanivorans TaxID=441119 RepID=A0A1I5VE11_9RHOB|nr:hypothetical protein [Tranquillimonas alkanivorans]SFQ05226.1 hypothetical protein SAMN04488047_12920 [Tranquillimonas alkanivorans]
MKTSERLDRDAWEARLREVERAGGFRQGYKLLYCPWAALQGSHMTFLSLNPGRPPREAELRVVSDERGNSYEVEQATTRSPLTDQFLRMCALLDVAPAQVLTGVVAPFRSDGWSALSPDQRRAALELGRAFWREALASPGRQGPLVVCSDQAAKLVTDLLDARLEETLPAGWGNIAIRCFRGAEDQRIVQLPHLSRFRLFGRPQSEPALARAFGLAAGETA